MNLEEKKLEKRSKKAHVPPKKKKTPKQRDKSLDKESGRGSRGHYFGPKWFPE